MKALSKFALGAVMAGSAAVVACPSFAADATVRTTAPRGADARPCRYFVHRHLPAPHRCYRYFSNMFGPDVYVNGDYVFRNRQAFLHWHERHAMPLGRLAERQEHMAPSKRTVEEERAATPRRVAEEEHGAPPKPEREEHAAPPEPKRYAEREEHPMPPKRVAEEERAAPPTRMAEEEHAPPPLSESAPTREEPKQEMAAASGGGSRGSGNVPESSGGASRGPEAAHESSGGATRGEKAEESASGGATRGEKAEEHASGGASGY